MKLNEKVKLLVDISVVGGWGCKRGGHYSLLSSVALHRAASERHRVTGRVQSVWAEHGQNNSLEPASPSDPGLHRTQL